MSIAPPPEVSTPQPAPSPTDARTVLAAQWERVGTQTINYLKWTQPGQVLEGVWIGPVDGRYGPQGQVDSKDGTRAVFTLHTALSKRLDEIPVGAHVRIQYDGLRHSVKSGRDYKSFQVFVQK